MIGPGKWASSLVCRKLLGPAASSHQIGEHGKLYTTGSYTMKDRLWELSEVVAIKLFSEKKVTESVLAVIDNILT